MPLQFEVTLSPPAVSDVVSRKLSVTVGDGTTIERTLFPDEMSVGGFEGNDRDIVEVSLVDLDGRGNASEPRTLSTVLVDTIAPPQPGELGIRVTGQS